MGLQYLRSANFTCQPPLVLALTSEMIHEEDHGAQKSTIEDFKGSITLEYEGFSEAEKKLYNILLGTRMELAKDSETAPYAICGDQILIKITKIRPSTRARLSNIEGVNQHLVTKYGDKFLQTISNASQELDLSMNGETITVTAATKKVYPSPQRNLNQAKFDAWKMWQMDKKSLKEVSMSGRSVPIKEQTVISYILEAARAGCEIDWARFCMEIGLTLEMVSQIHSAVSKVGSKERLKPIKEELPENVSYEHIKTHLMMEDLKISADEVFECKSSSLLRNTATELSKALNSAKMVEVPTECALVKQRAECKSSPEAVNARKEDRSDSLVHEPSAKKLHTLNKEENSNVGLEATENSIMEFIKKHDGVALSEITSYFGGSKADVADILGCLEAEYLIFKKNDLYLAM